MADPLGAEAASELLVFNALTAGVTLAGVYQDVPASTKPPLVIVADLAAEPIDAKVQNGSKRLTLTITSEYWGSKRAPLLAIMSQVVAALKPKLSGFGFTVSLTEQSSDARQIDDKIYFGTNTFAGFAIAN